MGRESDSVGSSRFVANAVFAGIGAISLILSPWSTYLSTATAMAISGLASLVGFEVSFMDGQLQWQHLTVSWTEDCSGVQTLFVLFGMTAWVSLRAPTSLFVLRLFLTVPMALGANIIRVLSICTLRVLLYPAWEGETLHFTIGCLTILPFAMLIAHRSQRTSGGEITWLVYLAAVLAVASLSIETPVGLFVLSSSVSYLVAFHTTRPRQRFDLHLTIVWLAVAFIIGGLRAESLWLPWLLACPFYSRIRATWHPASWVCLVGTVPLFASNAVVQILIVAAVIWVAYDSFACSKHDAESRIDDVKDQRTSSSPVVYLVVASAILLPGLSELALHSSERSLRPPAGLMSAPIGQGEAYRVRTVGQSDDIAAFWHGSARNGRHHSIATCLRYRGIHASVVPKLESVLQSDSDWITEFFLMDGEVCQSYRRYLMRCFPPFTSQGVHVVFQAPKSSMQPHVFRSQARKLAEQLQRSQRHAIASRSRHQK